jgi:hypothetical protein
MFKKNTLLVLGAGASHDLGFPLGRTFKSDIAELIAFRTRVASDGYAFDGVTEEPSNHEFEIRLRHYIASKNLPGVGMQSGPTEASARQAMKMVARGVGFAPSIDVFLKMRSGDPHVVLCSKAAIATLILKCEQDALSHLVPTDSVEWFPALDMTWYQAFCEICFSDTEGPQQIEEALSRISIVSFNYDRCIEQLVRTAIECLYSLPRVDATRLASKLKVLHPYGSLGPLPSGPGDAGVSFGADVSTTNAGQMFDGIKTFSEQPSLADEIQQTTSAANNIVILGFGYHKPNVDLLRITTRDAIDTKRVYGTALGLAETTIDATRRALESCFSVTLPNGTFPASVYLKNGNCMQLLDEFRGGLIDQ